MKDFHDFIASAKSDYGTIHDKVSRQTEQFIEQHDESPMRRNEVYAELFALELLERYHNWNSN